MLLSGQGARLGFGYASIKEKKPWPIAGYLRKNKTTVGYVVIPAVVQHATLLLTTADILNKPHRGNASEIPLNTA